jgi:hypothetical protein
LEEIKLINGGGITSLNISHDNKFAVASGVNNCVRVFHPDFSGLISEAKTGTPVSYSSIDIYSKKVVNFLINGSISLLDVEN